MVNEIEPVEAISKETLSKEDYEKYNSLGENLIRNGQLAVCSMAGGQGTRLGHNGPKGTFVVNFTKIPPKSIFQINAEKMLKAYTDYGIYLDWYIMTSVDNDKETKDFFEKNGYFGYPKEKIVFFVQGRFPLLNRQKETIKDKSGNEVLAANGNGGIFKALKDEKIIDLMAKKGIKYLATCNVDNILINPIDNVSLGLLAENETELGIKSLIKTVPEEKVGMIVKKEGKTTVIEYIDFPKEMLSKRDKDGNLVYSESHFGCNYISLALLERIAEKNLPIHEAYKKNDEYGEYIKQEMFIFDGFEMANSSKVIRVKREDEFAPIKNKEGVDSPETAIVLYENKYFE